MLGMGAGGGGGGGGDGVVAMPTVDPAISGRGPPNSAFGTGAGSSTVQGCEAIGAAIDEDGISAAWKHVPHVGHRPKSMGTIAAGVRANVAAGG